MEKFSKYPSFGETRSLFNLLGPRKESLSTAGVKLQTTVSMSPLTWAETVTGIACFIKDYDRKAYFIEVLFKNKFVRLITV